MRRLFASEMTRLASRRLFRWVLVLFIAALLFAAAVLYVNDDGTFTRKDMRDVLLGLSFPLLMFGWLVGASAIGAEWGNRTVSALLTWEPRRTRVLLVKATAAAVSTGLWVVALQIVFTAAMLPSTGGQDPFAGGAFSWSGYVETGTRILAASVAASLVGFALATIGKNTGAALGGGMAYLLIAEPLVRAWKTEWSDWLLSTNIARVIGDADIGFNAQTTTEAALVLAAYVAGFLLVALWFFRRREMA